MGGDDAADNRMEPNMTRSYTTHTNAAAALSTAAEHFAIVGCEVSAFTDEDACWRFIHAQRAAYGVDHPLYARYAARRELAA